jgi:hypothetical protein
MNYAIEIHNMDSPPVMATAQCIYLPLRLCESTQEKKNKARQRNNTTAFETPRCWWSIRRRRLRPLLLASTHGTKPKRRQNNDVRDAKVLVGYGGGG